MSSFAFISASQSAVCTEIAINLCRIAIAAANLTLMEIQLLKLSVDDADLNEMALQAFVWPDAIRDVYFAVKPEGVRVTGVYQHFVGIPFQMLWQISVSDGKLVARIERMRAGFFNIGFIKNYLLKFIAAAMNSVICDGMLVFDVDALIADKGWPVRLNFTSIRCTLGSLILESRARGWIHEPAGE
jgi:hypothetical protein